MKPALSFLKNADLKRDIICWRNRMPDKTITFDEIIQTPTAMDNYRSKMEKETENSYPSVETLQIVAPDFIPRIAVDFGANIGTFCKQALSKFTEVHAFEPSTRLCDLITKNIGTNNNLHTYRLAAETHSGRIMNLYAASNGHPGDSSLYSAEQDSQYETCMTVAMEDVFKLIRTDYVDYMKIDIEGAEYPFLMNKDLSHIGIIAMEVHGGMYTDTQYTDLLEHIFKYMHMWRMHKGDAVLTCVNRKYRIQYAPLFLDQRGGAQVPRAMEQYIGKGQWEEDTIHIKS